VAQAAEAVKKGIGTSIVDLAGADIGAITPETVIAAAKKQDNVALMIVECAAAQLGVRAAYLVNIFKPAALVIGGGLEAAGELAMHTIEKTVRKLAAAKYITSLKILPASTGETAVSSGASLLAIREVFLNA
jgi:glucokinase